MIDSIRLDGPTLRAFTCPTCGRTPEDIHIVYAFLRRLETFSRLGDHALKAIASYARYEKHEENTLLFR
ncbi:unnamed protein product [Soboliphyme baturini]|uniref:PhoU domain-containing protein n=1 Tax=Soboliphyme baturini TaxID=241478 RepID=A0A183IU75_9BILA|nr:unnamed protein product [Soboliphyme baturini]